MSELDVEYDDERTYKGKKGERERERELMMAEFYALPFSLYIFKSLCNRDLGLSLICSYGDLKLRRSHT
jgi:hypothetical protein